MQNIQEITKNDLGNVTTIRENSTRGEEVVKIELDKIVVRDGFNVRHDLGDIEGLAASILANGQTIAGRVDVLAGGTFALVDGHRRYAACKLLEKQGHAPLFKAIVNPNRTTEEQRILQMFTTQDNKQLLPNEIADLIQRLINLGYNVSTVANKIGKSVTYVAQMLDYAEKAPAIKEHVKNGKLTVAGAIQIKKQIPNTAERIERTNKAVESKTNGKITAADVTDKKINSFSDLKKYLEYEIDTEGLAVCKLEVFNFACAIINNEMGIEDIKNYFSK